MEDSKKLVEMERQKTKEIRLEIITKTNVEIAYCNRELQTLREEKHKLYQEIKMFQEIVNAKDKTNKDFDETVEEF